MKIKKITTVVFFGLIVLLGLCNLYCTKNNQTNLVYLNHHDTVKYVGKQQCASCHTDIYNSFILTGMGQSFAPATKEKSVAKFGKKHVVFDRYKNLWYYPQWINDSLYITEFRIKGKDTIYKRSERVDYIIGSGQHTNSHLTNVNGYIYQLPLTWYAQKQTWDLPPGFENGRNVRFTRNIEIECMSCHNAMPAVKPKSDNVFTNIPNGIDCERCHGPGELHVKEKLAGVLVDTSTQIDYTIVNPKKLSWELQVDVCQRCHLQGNAVLKTGKNFTDFKPGMYLKDFVDVFMPKPLGNNNSYIMASHAQRLQMSKCFTKTNNNNNAKNKDFKTLNLTCITCHNPHVSVKVTGYQIFNNACQKCHQANNGCSEKKNIIALKNNNCVNCHMPKNGTEDIPHVTVHDHYIRKPQKTENNQSINKFAAIYCVNNPNVTDESFAKGYLNYYEKFEGNTTALDSAWQWINNMPSGNNQTLKIQYYFYQNRYKEIIDISKKIKDFDAWTCYRIGQAFQSLSLYNQAANWYQKSITLSPHQLNFLNKLGSIYILTGEFNHAVNILTQSLLKQPKQEDALINLGFAYLQLGYSAKALAYYNKALQLNPDNTQALYNRAAVFALQNNYPKALADLNQIIMLNPNNAEIKNLLKALMIKNK